MTNKTRSMFEEIFCDCCLRPKRLAPGGGFCSKRASASHHEHPPARPRSHRSPQRHRSRRAAGARTPQALGAMGDLERSTPLVPHALLGCEEAIVLLAVAHGAAGGESRREV